MTRCWVRNAGVFEAAGPYTLDELRALRRAGLLPATASASLSAYEGFRVIAQWPELSEALDSRNARVLRGVTDLKMGEHHAVPGAARPESSAPVGKVSSLPMVGGDYEDTNAADKSAPVDTLEILRGNLEAEAVVRMRRTPWYRHPYLRNLGRFLPLALIATPLLYFGYGKVETEPFVGVAMLALGGLIFCGGAFFTFIVSPARWGVD